MLRVNDAYLKLSGEYLFTEIGRRARAYEAAHPEKGLIRLGIGDVTLPLAEVVVEALERAAREQARAQTFRGYGPEQGYLFLREAICANAYAGLGIDPDEVFISDGAKCDVGNFQEILGAQTRIAVQDPVYPVYVDSTVMAGRAGVREPDGRWSRIVYLPCAPDNGFEPPLPDVVPDAIYLCSPNNPTGMAMSRKALAKWVAYAHEHGCLILFDAAYEAYVHDPDVPRSIYEIDGAREVAVEFRSFSKSAGFTGLRCAWCVVPSAVAAHDGKGRKTPLRPLWARRQATKYNGCPYIVQRAAQAVFSREGREQTANAVAAYMANAAIMREGLARAGFTAWGGVNAPYIWLAVPSGQDSWGFFDTLLNRFGILGTPGDGFGPGGQGFFRLTAFGAKDDTQEAMRRLAAGGA